MDAVSQNIKQYLDNRALEDALFAKSYTKPNKSFEECMQYIKGEAKKRAQNGCAMISKEETYGLAVHYYDEDNIKINKVSGSVSTATSPRVELTEEEKAQLKAKAEAEFKETYIQRLQAEEKEKARKLAEKKRAKQTEVQPSLFDF